MLVQSATESHGWEALAALGTVDLTKNDQAIPLVDDLGAIPLSLRADEHGYCRLQANLLGA